MSYLSTLVATPIAASASRPAAAAIPAPGVEASLEQHVEVESSVPPTPARVPTAAQAAPSAPGRATQVAGEGMPSASVEGAPQTAFARVAPRHAADASVPAAPTAPRMPAPSRGASLEIRADAAIEATEIEPVVEMPSASRRAPADRSGRAGAARALPHPEERIDVTRVAGERAEAAQPESQAAREPTPQRALLPASARQPASHDGAAADPQSTPQPASIRVRIGSIALHVRTPPAPTPPAQAAPIAATPAAAEAPRAPAPPFAFSAQRHHLRWI